MKPQQGARHARAPEFRRPHPLIEVARLGVDRDEADPPEASAHDVEAEEPGDEPVDVAATGKAFGVLLDLERPGGARRALQDRFGEEASFAAVGTGRKTRRER